ncbi:hypothetical protein [Rubrobacter radiotolerans]|uniref:DUF4352 domain-containing protein n=1 Tax=Rubrobacter radiotolerans TaxID=42256 RepID=A0AB35T3Q5_RUBRA|nr:hypothetical protein [Rubrobacter radiotolerans]MDX5893696.1 hypothetical protein [Rubrobacter radiotolerans]
MHKMTTVGLVLLLGIMFVGCSGSTNDLPEAEEAASQENTSSVSEAPPEASEVVSEETVNSEQGTPPENPNVGLAVGETASIMGGIDMTVERVFTLPEEGGEIPVIVQVNVRNVGDEVLELGGTEIDFYMYNQDSYDLSSAYPDQYYEDIPRENDEIIGNEVRSGGNFTGTLPFAAQPEDSLLLEWNPSFDGEAVASWEIGSVSELPAGTLLGGAAAEQYNSQ